MHVHTYIHTVCCKHITYYIKYQSLCFKSQNCEGHGNLVATATADMPRATAAYRVNLFAFISYLARWWLHRPHCLWTSLSQAVCGDLWEWWGFCLYTGKHRQLHICGVEAHHHVDFTVHSLDVGNNILHPLNSYRGLPGLPSPEQSSICWANMKVKEISATMAMPLPPMVFWGTKRIPHVHWTTCWMISAPELSPAGHVSPRNLFFNKTRT